MESEGRTLTLGSQSYLDTEDDSLHASDNLEFASQSFSRKQRWNDLEIDSVIFGCTNITVDECINRKLFGLPISHFSYVKMVKPGMPLFLFNYISKKLLGVFEAVSYGKQNIDSFAWTGPSPSYEVKTRFPAQACVRLREDFEKVISLEESDFQSLIKENYYTNRRFFFDLNRLQTYHLIKKFETARDCLKRIADALGASSSASGARGWKTTSSYILQQAAPEYLRSVKGTREALRVNIGSKQQRPATAFHQLRYRDNRIPSFPVRNWYHALHPANVPTVRPVAANTQEVVYVTLNRNLHEHLE